MLFRFLRSTMPSAGKFFLLIIFIGTVSQTTMAQNLPAGQAGKQIDSLLSVLKTAREDSNKVNILNELCERNITIGRNSDAKEYADSALQLAEKLNFRIGFGLALSNIGKAHQNQGNYREALKYHRATLKIFEELGNKSRIAATYVNLANINTKQGNYPEGLQNSLASLKISEETGDKKSMAAAYNSLGNIYTSLLNFREALKCFRISLEINKALANKRGIAVAFLAMANVYNKMNNNVDASAYNQAALKIAKELEEKNLVAICYNNMGELSRLQTNYAQALKYFLEVRKMEKEMEKKDGIASIDLAIAQLYADLRKPAEARKYLDEALNLSKKTGRIGFIMESYEQFIELDSLEGNHKSAYKHFRLFMLYKDSLRNEKNNEQVTEIKVKYETENKDKEITLLNNEKMIQKLNLEKQKQIKAYLIAGLGLFAILSFFVYRNYRTRQRLKLQTIRNKIASDLHDDVGSTLSSISIFSEMAKQQSKEVIPMLDTIGESSRKMLDAMADIVWTINPENDQFEKIILRMRSFAYELLGAKKIDFEFVADDDAAKMKLPMDVRKNLYLIFKEATNNMVKYSEADRAFFSVKKEANNLTMLIRDNGKGFDTGHAKEGNGLINMKKRASEIGALFSIDSLPGNGTTIQLKIAV